MIVFERKVLYSGFFPAMLQCPSHDKFLPEIFATPPQLGEDEPHPGLRPYVAPLALLTLDDEDK